MSERKEASQFEYRPKRASVLRDERLHQLMESCQQEVLRQIIGPFGLSPAMFDDKDGGNVTTQHNAQKGIFAKASEELNRADYDYSAAKREKMKEAVADGSMNSQTFVDQYTGKVEPTKRENSNGKLVMNAELDHLIPVKDIHSQGGWMKDKQGRTDLSSNKENLHYTTQQTNRSKGAKSPEQALSAEKGFDSERIDPLVSNAKKAVDENLPSTSERIKYHGMDLAREGARDAGKNALRQALGILLQEFVNGGFSEVKTLLRDRHSDRNLIDRLIESLKRVSDRVIGKLKTALSAAAHGALHGFISLLLTFLINNLITTAKRVVTIIREGTQGLCKAIMLMVNPPKDMPTLEVARQATKMIASVVTMGLGMLMEESIKGFIMSIPILAPVADALALALTAIVTGVISALVVYGVDRLFDWLSSSSTEQLAAQEQNLVAQTVIGDRLQAWLSHQFNSSSLYAACEADYERIQKSYRLISLRMETAVSEAANSTQARNSMIETVEAQLDRRKRFEEALRSI